MKTRIHIVAAATVLLGVSACNQPQPETVDATAPDPMASQLANAAPVELPPAMTATKTFRCKDNSLVSVDFFAGEKQVNLRPTPDASPVMLRSETAGGPYTGGGYTLSGSQTNITLAKPGGASLTCRT